MFNEENNKKSTFNYKTPPEFATLKNFPERKTKSTWHSVQWNRDNEWRWMTPTKHSLSATFTKKMRSLKRRFCSQSFTWKLLRAKRKFNSRYFFEDQRFWNNREISGFNFLKGKNKFNANFKISAFHNFFFPFKKTRTQTQDLVSYLAPCRRVLLNVKRYKLTFSPQTIITAFLAKLQKKRWEVY